MHGVRDIRIATGYEVCCDTRGRPGIYDRDIIGSYIYFKTTHNGWRLARVVLVAEEDAPNQAFPHTIILLDMGKRYNVHLHKGQVEDFQ